jgi:hypothetical protein
MFKFYINRKILYTAFFSLLACFTSSQLFAGGADNQIINSLDIMNESSLGNSPSRILVLSGKEDIKTPYDDLLSNTPFIPINKITEPIVLKEGLFVTKYNSLLREKLTKEYPKAFQSKTISKYFFKTLAERAYSYNGYLAPNFFNAVVNGRTIFYRIRYYIDSQKFSPLIKKALMYLYLQETVYVRNIKDPRVAIKSLAKIPEYPVLYIIGPPDFLLAKIKEEEIAKGESKSESKDKSKSTKKRKIGDINLSDTRQNSSKIDFSAATDEYGNQLEGNFLNFERGNNLYFICATYYKDFSNLPPEKQLKILDLIYSFNSTLTQSRPIRADNSFISYLKMQFNDIQRDQFLKYRLKTNETWLILPRSLDIYKNLKIAKNND